MKGTEVLTLRRRRKSMTAESTVLAKSVRFLEHVSPGCYAGIASIVLVSWSA